MRRIGFHDRGGEIEIKSILEREQKRHPFQADTPHRRNLHKP